MVSLFNVTLWQWSLINHTQWALGLKGLSIYTSLDLLTMSPWACLLLPCAHIPGMPQRTLILVITSRAKYCNIPETSKASRSYPWCVCGWNLRYNDLQGHCFSVYHNKWGLLVNPRIFNSTSFFCKRVLVLQFVLLVLPGSLICYCSWCDKTYGLHQEKNMSIWAVWDQDWSFARDDPFALALCMLRGGLSQGSPEKVAHLELLLLLF